MAPFPIEATLGPLFNALVYVLIGVGFGAVLEMSGFGDTRKLAAQFYFTELTVLKVMFTAIIVAMVLVYLASALGLLDFNRVWVNPTFLWPGILGGLVMGFGFIIGGFCPGTSLVALATLKVDAMFFVAGAAVGILLFGETVSLYDGFWNSSAMGRYLLSDWLGLPAGVVVIAVVLMALGAFKGAEILERTVGKGRVGAPPAWRVPAAGALLVLAGVAAFVGQPDLDRRWAQVASHKDSLLTGGAVAMDPLEVQSLLYNDSYNLVLADLRGESDWNRFHLVRSRRVDPGTMVDFARRLAAEPKNTVVVLLDRDGSLAAQAWKDLTALGVPNTYLLAGGLDNWLDQFAPLDSLATGDPLAARFPMALGHRVPAADPGPPHGDGPKLYTPKLRMGSGATVKKGGCG
jgi:rhodanese-related sulfurtransferase